MKTEFIDVFHNRILLTNKRWKHIIKEHPEVEPYRKLISVVLKQPDLIKMSKRRKNTFLYYRYYNTIYNGKYILAVARVKEKPSLLTCYYNRSD
ncbi:hypothetical protein HYV81_04180 [Candidatus Woesearchaeota archaeon]|nr:hypothetical protein [Candidatus Woesearchaeota archaeon]